MLTIGDVAELTKIPTRRIEAWVERDMLEPAESEAEAQASGRQKRWRHFDAGELAVAIGLANLDRIDRKLVSKPMADSIRAAYHDLNQSELRLTTRYAELKISIGKLRRDAQRAFDHVVAA